MRTFLKIVVILLAVAAIALAVLVFTDFSSPRLAQALVQMAASTYDVDLEIDRATLNLRRGLLLEGVVVHSEAEGEQLSAALDRLVLEHRLWPLLEGRLVVERLVLERPNIEMVSSEPGVEAAPSQNRARGAEQPEAVSPPADSGRLDLEVGEVVIEQGRLASRSSFEGGSTALEGMNLVLRGVSVDPAMSSLVLAVSGEGWLDADSLSLGEHQLDGIETAFEAERGRLRLAGFETSSRAGTLKVEEIEIDLAQNPYRYRAAIRAEDIDLGQVLGLPAGLGAARVEMLGNGEGPGMAGAVAEMTLRVDAGTLPSVEILELIDQLVGTTLDGVAYEPLDLRLSLAGGMLEIDPFDITTESARIEMGGSIDRDGSLDLKVAVGIPRDLFSRGDISVQVLDHLTRRDWLTIPLRVTGTVEKPRFSPDMDAFAASTRYLAEQAKESLRARFRVELGGAIGRLRR